MGNCQCQTKKDKLQNQNHTPISNIVIQRIQSMGYDISKDSKEDLENISNPDFKRLILCLPDEMFCHLPQNIQRQKPTVSVVSSPKMSYEFMNWGENVSVNYEYIFYPFKSDDTNITKENQIQSIRAFVRKGGFLNKRIRGSAMRHSYSNIFGDPNQLLVSFYPSDVATGSSSDLQHYAIQMIKLEKALQKQSDATEHLCMIRYQGFDQIVKKHLVKVGAGVSNQQLRRWCIRNNLQYASNAIPVEVSFCGALAACCHGSGINTKTLADYVYEIQFIDYKGQIHTISKKNEPQLIASAASSLGLLGLIIFVTIQMERAQIIKTEPKKMYKDDIIPYPKAWCLSREFLKRRELQRKRHNKKETLTWEQKFASFKASLSKTYGQWLYFTLEEENIYENSWSVYAEKSPQAILELEKKGKPLLENYPPPLVKMSNYLVMTITDFLFNNQLNRKTQKSILGTMIMKNPFLYFPKKQTYLHYVDGIHSQRGLHNFKMRFFQAKINIPNIKRHGRSEPDYDLIQKVWWEAFEIVQQNKRVVNMSIEMRFYQGSQATLAPQFGFNYVCCMQIFRTLATSESEGKWEEILTKIFEVWKGLKDSNNEPVKIRVHWAKEWTHIPRIRAHVLEDQQLKENIRNFWRDYQTIAKIKCFDAFKNINTFSNQTYRQLLTNAIPYLSFETQKNQKSQKGDQKKKDLSNGIQGST